MAKFTISPTAINNLAQAFLSGGTMRENAKQNALQTQLMQQQLDMGALASEQAQKQAQAQQHALGDYLAATYGLTTQQATDASDYLRGQRERNEWNNEWGYNQSTPIQLPDVFQNPQTLAQARAQAAHFAGIGAYGTDGAVNMQRGLGLADQRNIYNSAMANALAAQSLDERNQYTAIANGKEYSPYGNSGGVLYNKTTGQTALNPLGEIAAQTAALKNQQILQDMDIDRQKLALQYRKDGYNLDGTALPHTLADPYFRDEQGNITQGATKGLNDTEVKQLYSVPDEFGVYRPDYQKYQNDYTNAQNQGFRSVADYKAHLAQKIQTYEKAQREAGGLNPLIDSFLNNDYSKRGTTPIDNMKLPPEMQVPFFKKVIPEGYEDEQLDDLLKQKFGNEASIHNPNPAELQQQLLSLMNEGLLPVNEADIIYDRFIAPSLQNQY